MSDQYWWKKQNERESLDQFICAYEQATGRRLTVIHSAETPDFFCETEDRQRVGVELTKIIAHPESRMWHRLFGDGAMALHGDIESEVAAAAARKANALRKCGREPADTLLVFELFDNPLTEKYRELERIDCDDFEEFGFAEIWLADRSTVEAFEQIDLFGLYPQGLAGYYQLTAGRKPFG